MDAYPNVITDDQIDSEADKVITKCVNLAEPKSFFLFAGAGSGKTKALVNCLDDIRVKTSARLMLKGQRIRVITYTNSACDEIIERLKHDPLVEVSTIHSFMWSLISGFNMDIREWLRVNLNEEIVTLEVQESKGRGGKASRDRQRSIKAKSERLASLDGIKKFTYNPNGDNPDRDSLSHSEVIKIGSYFLAAKETMQKILVFKYPILLVDESQDTNKNLVDALFEIQKKWSSSFCLGLFGDMMQRIYADGKADLGQSLPDDWEKPVKVMNHRCPKRVIALINKIRSSSDGQQQRPRSDAIEGTVRLYLLPASCADRQNAERIAAMEMAVSSKDEVWRTGEVKKLILEHHMAWSRMGILQMCEPLSVIEHTSLLEGSLSGLRLFSEQVLPLVQAKQSGDEFLVAAIVRRSSPLISKAALLAAGSQQGEQVAKANEAVGSLIALFSENKQPRFIEVLRSLSASGLFEIPSVFAEIVSRSVEEQRDAETSIEARLNDAEADSDNNTLRIACWDKMLITPFGQIEAYKKYVEGNAEFDTHQGVKGREFPRVMVILNDEEARGFLFGYDKLFGAKNKSKTDLEHEARGEETGIDRTRRLFYVTCSRAQASLAIVYYSTNPEVVRDFVVSNGWFKPAEVVML